MTPEPPTAADAPARPDLRLFGFAGGAWAATVLTLAAGTAGGLWITGAAAVSVALLGLAARSARGRSSGTVARRLAWAGAAALLGVTVGGASTAPRTWARDGEPLATLVRDRATVTVELTVTDDPRPVRSTRVGPPTYLIRADLNRLRTPDGTEVGLQARVIVFATAPAWRTLLPSQRVAVDAGLAPAQGGDLTAAALTAHGEPRLLGAASWAQSAAGRLRAGLQAACAPLPAEPRGLLPGLVIGDTSGLDPAVAEDFRATGLTHLVAVSGANVAIVLGVVLLAVRWCRAGPVLAAVVCLAALAGFVVLARPSPSVVRAAAMGAVGLLALATGRQRSAAPALAVAAVAGLVIDPALAVDAGFALSVLATGGLVLLAPRWRDRLRERGVPAGLAEAVAVSAAAQVVCGPVVVALSGEVSLVAVPANLLAVPVIAPATLLGVGAAVVSPLWPELAALLAWLAAWPARWLVAVADVGANVPAGAVPWPAGVGGAVALTVVTIGLFLIGRWPVGRRVVLVAAIGVAVGSAPVRWLASGWPPSDAVLVACDVGQGDAVVLPVGPGDAVVVDAGPDPVAVDGCLRRLGVRRISLLIITHFHIDHIGGVPGVARGRTLATVVVPRFDEPAAGERVLRATVGGAGVVETGAGWRVALGTLDLTVLAPTRPITGTRSDPNNNSLIVRAVNRGVSILLAGDAETEQQHALVAATPSTVLRAQVLKVAHHGSGYQDPALLAAVDPVVAVVSVGADNPYGHPSPDLLDRLRHGGARVARTDLDGDLAVVATADGVGLVARGRTN